MNASIAALYAHVTYTKAIARGQSEEAAREEAEIAAHASQARHDPRRGYRNTGTENTGR